MFEREHIHLFLFLLGDTHLFPSWLGDGPKPDNLNFITLAPCLWPWSNYVTNSSCNVATWLKRLWNRDPCKKRRETGTLLKDLEPVFESHESSQESRLHNWLIYLLVTYGYVKYVQTAQWQGLTPPLPSITPYFVLVFGSIQGIKWSLPSFLGPLSGMYPYLNGSLSTKHITCVTDPVIVATPCWRSRSGWSSN